MSNFNVIFWRHAEAEDALGSTQGDETDLRRNLTKQGRRDAAQVAGWIKSQLPKPWTVISSPAQRARQTAQHLNDYAGTDARLRPDASMEELLSIVSEFPRDGGGLILVGHQPTLGRAGLYWITGCDQQFSMRKSGLLWAVERSREVGIKRSLRACISADLLAD
ncbi:SixA phosphatase family protein [Thiomonas bhubaneswarensis]|uniref:Phosphohistidine phosphatase, SixA n=1 Tax=Thiomonas bhubaneswarensis TaxID=339866 RepID=A0A0K6IA90_9BURK|nr:histidine phosphatase family protein [Thiomonas bhubaneswarensis]CUB00227.1 phosphohistidine phosphatase, SixA [Thiomonas bhubaneswarensis]